MKKKRKKNDEQRQYLCSLFLIMQGFRLRTWFQNQEDVKKGSKTFVHFWWFFTHLIHPPTHTTLPWSVFKLILCSFLTRISINFCTVCSLHELFISSTVVMVIDGNSIYITLSQLVYNNSFNTCPLTTELFFNVLKRILLFV